MATNTPDAKNPASGLATPRDMGPGEPGSGGKARGPQPDARAPQGASQKAQIVQYLKSQNVKPDDVVWNVGGLQLRLKDLDG